MHNYPSQVIISPPKKSQITNLAAFDIFPKFMANSTLLLFFTLLALTTTNVAAARVLDEVDKPVPTTASDEHDSVAPLTTGAAPVVAGAATATGVLPTTAPDEHESVAPPIAGAAPVVAGAATAAGATVATAEPHHPLTFFMHDILGGSNPSAMAITGIISNLADSGQVPFAKPNGANLPVNSGVSANSNNLGIINNNNVPFLTGLGDNTAANAAQNNGNNQINNGFGGVPILNGGQLASGNIFDKFMFGTLTVIDDELTEGHELGSALIGKAQGFYVASSVDGKSQTMAFTAMFESGGYEDTISFFGVHRKGVSESQLAIMGGTGKYLNAKGYATVKTFSATNQHETDGAETLLQIIVYLAY